MKNIIYSNIIGDFADGGKSTVQAAPQEVTMWHYFDQKPEQEMLRHD